jgi:20S proteasome alpha/beta subunit
MKRDSASGDGMMVATITPEGISFVDEKDLHKRMARMKLST